MNDDDLPIHDVFDLGGSEPPPPPDELRAIVERAGRRWRRMAVLVTVAALLVGGGVGYAVAGGSGSNGTAVGSASAPTIASSGAPTGGFSSTGTFGVGGSTQYTRLFLRTVGAVTVRGFKTNFGGVAPNGCGLGPPMFMAEVSTPQMVGQAPGLAPVDRSKAISGLTTTVAGQEEGDPVAVVSAATGSKVAKVQVRLVSGAVDQMAPVQGWVALVGAVSANGAQNAIGTLQAFDAAGHVLSQGSVSEGTGMNQLGVGCSVACDSSSGATTTSTTNPAVSSATWCMAGGGSGGACAVPVTPGTSSTTHAGPPSVCSSSMHGSVSCGTSSLTVPTSSTTSTAVADGPLLCGVKGGGPMMTPPTTAVTPAPLTPTSKP